MLQKIRKLLNQHAQNIYCTPHFSIKPNVLCNKTPFVSGIRDKKCLQIVFPYSIIYIVEGRFCIIVEFSLPIL